MSTKQPEALRLADALERPGYGWHSTPAQCAAELRRQHAEIADLRAQLAAIGAGGVSPLMGAAGDAASEPAKRDLRSQLQQQCSTWGAYWRASDSHGVELTHAQAVELLESALGVEVEVKPIGCQTCYDTGMIGGPSYYDPGEGGVPCPDCAHLSPPEGAAGDAGWRDHVEQRLLTWRQIFVNRSGDHMSTKQNDETQARWYMVNKDGMATLCKDHADAKQEAADAKEVWPHLGPHRAVQLVEVSQAFTAADMATAAAQGFRDGQSAQTAVAAGWVMVPKEPTLAMGWAYLDAARESEPLRTHLFNHDGYRAMIAAAPFSAKGVAHG